ncbi:hypothetical protein V8C44DRAFT_325221 [Trichoderma aethiopicum]
MSDPHKYTVGWICAITSEYVAAQAFLEDKHENPEYVSPQDNNNYTLGRIGRHNVVIAALPYGEYGLASAASVARDMLHSFPNVRIGLMVGIGGGAPSAKHDIRLGDVVVGISNTGQGAVVQYDFGKAMQGQGFQETGFLNQAPTLLRAAVGGLRAKYESEGNRIQKAVDEALAKKPRLQKKYSRPEASSDRLYQSLVVHLAEGEAECSSSCGDDPSSLIKRPERNEVDDAPAIHYGLIASANTLMKDALARDRLIAKKDVLCFEMEAAGMMNHIPCLVIRGICDYSDSHKNDEWQGYAAMTAAAYAKDLLSQIAPRRIEEEEKIKVVLADLQELAKERRDIAREQLQAQKDFAKERLSKEEQQCHQLFRLTVSGKDATYEWYKDRVEKRVEDTCLWLLKHEHFQAWLKQESGPLLVTADPGCGKSVLAKYLIDDGLPRSATICYFFFKDQDQNTSRQALCAVLHQLFAQKPSLIEHAMLQFRTDGPGLINSTESLWKILRNAIRDPEAGSIIIVFDALDECAESEFASLMRNIESQLYNDQSGNSKRKYLLTCRPYEQITSQFHRLLKRFPNIRIPGEEESEAISQEVNHVITHRVNQLSAKKRLSFENATYLKTSLQKISHRTYLWLYLIFDYLEKEDFRKTLKGIDDVINTLPKSINEAYEQILSKSKEDKDVRKALSIILAASRPLSLSEMNIAMNIDESALSGTGQVLYDTQSEDESDFKSRLRSWCGLFISIYHGKVYFLHQTAREFLLADLASRTATPSGLRWQHSITTRQAHNTLAELCILYLDLFNSSVRPAAEVDKETCYSADINAFLEYSSGNWGDHLREAHIDDNDPIIPAALRICDPFSKSFSKWSMICCQLPSGFAPRMRLTGLIVASYYGHCAVAQLMIDEGADLEARDGFGLTPLSWAAYQGHETIIKLLVDKGASLKAKNLNGQTPLLLAADQGHKAIVKLLVDKGADLEARDKLGWTPLSWASRKGHEAIIKLLVDQGADLEAQIKTNHTPLSLAAKEGDEAIVKLLLDKGANPEARGEFGRTPLSWAAEKGHEAIVKLLVEKGANLETKDRYGMTALSWAFHKGHEAIAKLLVD